MLRSAMLAVSRNNAVKRAVVGFGPTSRVVDRFVAGESLDDCVASVRRLVGAGLLATVDHLGEDTTTEALASATTESYLELLRRLPERVLVQDPANPAVHHLLALAAEKAVPVEQDPDLPYAAASLIRSLADA